MGEKIELSFSKEQAYQLDHCVQSLLTDYASGVRIFYDFLRSLWQKYSLAREDYLLDTTREIKMCNLAITFKLSADIKIGDGKWMKLECDNNGATLE